MKIGTNVIVLVVGWVLILGIGVYLTFFRQPKEIEVLQKAEEVARMKNTELISLQTQHVEMSEQTNQTLRKWHSRYKVVPDELESPAVVGRLNALSREGFKNFDIAYAGVTRTSDFSYHVFSITGRGYFTSLYRFIWEVENGREMYRVRDLSLDHLDLTTQDKTTGRERLEVMVSFTLRLEAYFAGITGVSAPVDGPEMLAGGDGTPLERAASLPRVPASLLPSRQPAVNPFFPGIMQEIPPNTHGLIDVEADKLVSIVGQKAVFQGPESFRTVATGDPVYLGRIALIDPIEGRVVVHLNKGGIYDEVELRLETPGRPRPTGRAASDTP